MTNDIPIIVTRRKSNGDFQRYNLLSTPLEKTFNPLAFQQNNNTTLQNTVSSNRKYSGSRVRRISSSGVSKRFPKDFFKMQTQQQIKINPNNHAQFILKRKRNFSNVQPLDNETHLNQTPKFNSKFKQIYNKNNQFSINNPKFGIEFLSHQKIQTITKHQIPFNKLKTFKIKNNSTRNFIRQFHKSNQPMTKKYTMIPKIDQQHCLPQKKQKKIAIINGTKVLLQQDQNGYLRIKKVLPL